MDTSQVNVGLAVIAVSIPSREWSLLRLVQLGYEGGGSSVSIPSREWSLLRRLGAIGTPGDDWFQSLVGSGVYCDQIRS